MLMLRRAVWDWVYNTFMKLYWANEIITRLLKNGALK